MNLEEKEKIKKLREEGLGYKKISNELGISEECKRKWWNRNRTKLDKTKLEEHTCLNCHKPFKAYPHENRKYCCHTCYIEDRFKGGDGDE